MISPKWQTMWVESQHCSKSVVNMPLPSQQAKKILEDLKNSCCSPNKAVQIEALKCWGVWIHNQSPDDWKLNTVCFSAVRPLLTKKLQPLHRDVDIFKLKLSLMWALLVKVEKIMQLEGPQYILEVFLQSCLTWLSSTNEHHHSESKINLLIFQLLLAVFNKDESLTDFDKEMFPPLSTDVLQIKKVFHRLADKFLNVFLYWRSVDDKSVVLKIWKHFLVLCELSYEHVPIPVWHKVFKLVGEISSEKDSPVKERLAFLHGCATTLKSALSSSKFIDFGNLLTTPCEVLLRKLVELCTLDCGEFRDSEMFLHSKQICEVLSEKSVAIGGYDLCIVVLDALEEFCLRSLFWGVWCGLVYCYKTLLKDVERTQLTKNETKFYRKLRGIAVNFELDRNYLHEDCIEEVEKHIGFLSIGCVCAYHDSKNEVTPQSVFSASKEIVPKTFGKFSVVPYRAKTNLTRRKIINVNFDLVKNVLNTLNIDSVKSLLDPGFGFRFFNMQTTHRGGIVPRNMSFQLKVEVDPKSKLSLIVSCHGTKVSLTPSVPTKRNAAVLCEDDQTTDEDVVSTPKTRSKKRAEDERKKESEMQTRKKRKSFEVLVQEIVRKNKERKTEKNSKRRKSPEAVRGKRNKKKIEHRNKENEKIHNLRDKGKNPEGSCRSLRSRSKEDPAKIQKKKEKKKMQSPKTDGKLENYFKVITKKSSNNAKEVKKPSRSKNKRKTSEKNCCVAEKDDKERKGEVGWKQTSLKTMMNPKSRVEKVKQGMQTRDKPRENPEEKPKPRNEDRKMVGSPLAKLSPFKEVLHDHEYAKINPENLKTYQRVFMSNNEKDKSKEKQMLEKTPPKSKSLAKVGNIETTNTSSEKKTSKTRDEKTADFSSEEKHTKADTTDVKNCTTEKKTPKADAIERENAIPEKKHSKADTREVKNSTIEKKTPKADAIERENAVPDKKHSKETKNTIAEKKTSKVNVLEIVNAITEGKTSKVEKPEMRKNKKIETEVIKSSEQNLTQLESKKLTVEDAKVPELSSPEKSNLTVEDQNEKTGEKIIDFEANTIAREEKSEESKPEFHSIEENMEVRSFCRDDHLEEFSENDSNSEKKGKKRFRMIDSMKPRKKFKPEEEEEEDIADEKLPLEVTEKENLEEKQPEMLLISPVKKDKTGCLSKNNGSPKTVNGAMSRALRIIGLVPESTMGRSWESSPRVEALKCKKAPNVDKNSRASKMLALLSENVVEADDVVKVSEEEINCGLVVATPPNNVKTLLSSMKSPKSIKKRKSIGFDDARNETVIYQINTPPSQILEEKRRGMRPFELALQLP